LEDTLNEFTTSTYFIKRTEAENSFKEELLGSKRKVIGDIEGPFGVGKSTTIDALYNMVANDPDVIAVKVDIDDLVGLELAEVLVRPDPESAESATAQKRRINRSWEAYKSLIEGIADHESLRIRPELEKRLKRLAMKPVGVSFRERVQRLLKVLFRFRPDEVSVGIPFSGITVTKSLEADDNIEVLDADASAFKRERNQVAQTMAALVKRKIKRHNLILFIDNFCYILNSEVEEWILSELLPNLPNTKLVLCRTDYDYLLPVEEQKVTSLSVSNFSVQETADYVRIAFAALREEGKLAAVKDIATTIYQQCEGHPLLTAIYVQLLLEKAKDAGGLTPEEVQELALEPKANERKKIAALITYFGDQNPSIKSAVEIMCVLRRFNRNLLAFVLEKFGEEAEIADQVLGQHSGLSIIYRRSINEDGIEYRVHDLIAAAQSELISKSNKERIKSIHTMAAEYYGEVIAELEEESSLGTYQRLHFYEQKVWQRLTRRWITHLAHDPNSAPAALELATRYFDSVFWWGEYLRFPFCEELIDHLQSLEPGQGTFHERVLSAISRFHKNFVPVRERHASEWGWIRETKAALLAIVTFLNLGAGEQDRRRLHLYGVLANYIAETYAVQAVHQDSAGEGASTKRLTELADKYYEEAYNALTKAEQIYQRQYDEVSTQDGVNNLEYERLMKDRDTESWYRIWTECERARFYGQTGRYEESLAWAGRAEDHIRQLDPNDSEMLGRLYETRASTYFAMGDLENAMEALACYALHAYGFIADNFTVGGDKFTYEFYREMVETTGKYFAILAEKHPQQLEKWWSYFHKFWRGEVEYITVSSTPPKHGAPYVEPDAKGQAVGHSLPLPPIPQMSESFSDDDTLLEGEDAQKLRSVYEPLREWHDQ
jgi:tetratricopeptide (TPR) repeat protein